jgi:hypothetical protein
MAAACEIAVLHPGHGSVAVHVVRAARIDAAVRARAVVCGKSPVNRNPQVERRHESRAHGKRRKIKFTEAQREPTDHRISDHRVCREIVEGDQRWSVIRTNHDCAWNPSPPAVHENPAAVMERSITPRSVVNPAPAPGIYPSEMAEPVRSPVGRHVGREPDRTKRSNHLPRAELVQIGIAGDVARYVARRHRDVFPMIPIHAPGVELIGGRSGMRIERGIIGAVRHHLRTQRNPRRFVADIDLGVAGADRDN